MLKTNSQIWAGDSCFQLDQFTRVCVCVCVLLSSDLNEQPDSQPAVVFYLCRQGVVTLSASVSTRVCSPLTRRMERGGWGRSERASGRGGWRTDSNVGWMSTEVSHCCRRRLPETHLTETFPTELIQNQHLSSRTSRSADFIQLSLKLGAGYICIKSCARYSQLCKKHCKDWQRWKGHKSMLQNEIKMKWCSVCSDL